MSRTTRFFAIPLALAATVTTTAARADIRGNWIAQDRKSTRLNSSH